MNTVNFNISPYARPGIPRKDLFPITFVKTEESIIKVVCDITGFSWEQISGRRGPTRLSNARMIMCYFLFTCAKLNKSEIGERVNKDHTTVIAALRKFKNYYKTEDDFRETVDKITSIIES